MYCAAEMASMGDKRISEAAVVVDSKPGPAGKNKRDTDGFFRGPSSRAEASSRRRESFVGDKFSSITREVGQKET